MYGWALLFVTAAFLHANEMITAWDMQDKSGGNSGRPDGASAGADMRGLHAAALVCYGLAAAYTQYFACVAVVMVYLYLLFMLWRQDRKRIRVWLICVAASVIGYVPWLFALVGQISAVRENYWILPLTWRSFGGCVKFLMKPAFVNDTVNTVLAVVLTTAYGMVFLWSGWKHKLGRNGRVFGKTYESQCFVLAAAGIWVLVGVVGFGFAASILIRPVFVYRYMIPASGCFWLGFALCMNDMLCKLRDGQETQQSIWLEIEGQKHRCGSSGEGWRFGSGCAILLLVVLIGLRDYRAFMGEEEFKAVSMRDTEEALSRIGQEDIVLYNFDQVQAVTGYYLPETVERLLWRVQGEKLIQEITSPCGRVEDVSEIRQMLEKMREEGKRKSIWFIGSFNSRDDIVAEWRDAGLKVEETGSFLLERYWFNVYKISISDHNTNRDHF